MPYDSNKYSSLQYFFRTVCASLCSMTFAFCFTYPFDVIHTRAAADLSPNGAMRMYPSTFQCFNLTHIDEGTYSLYKGAGFAITSSMLRACLTIPVYELFSRFKTGQESHLERFWSRVGLSMVSGTLISVLIYPLDTLKRIAQLNGGRVATKLYKSDMEIAAKAMKEIGTRNLYRGVGPFAASQVLLAYSQFCMFELFNFHRLGLN